LLAIAIALASLASAWAATGQALQAISQQQSGANDSSDMSDCERMMQPGKSTCPDCDPDKGCIDKFCAAKCLKVLGHLPEPQLLRVATLPASHPYQFGVPSHWSERPPPTPPQT
jgi:hypothetical protein